MLSQYRCWSAQWKVLTVYVERVGQVWGVPSYGVGMWLEEFSVFVLWGFAAVIEVHAC